MSSIEEHLDHCFKRYFSLIVNGVDLLNLKKEMCGMAGLYKAEGKHVVITLINERGCVSYDLYSKHRSSCNCDGELLAEVLSPRDEKERKRSVRRLNLEEQTQLILEHWEEIETMMDQENAPRTSKTLNCLGTERSRVIFK